MQIPKNFGPLELSFKVSSVRSKIRFRPNPATFSNPVPVPVPVPAKYWSDLAGFYIYF